MYLRETHQKRADGSLVTHLQLAESTWNRQKKRSEVRIVYNCGREPHCGIISGWRALRSVHGDTDPVPVGAEIRPPPGVDRVDEKVY